MRVGMWRIIPALVVCLVGAMRAWGGDAAVVEGEPVLERPTLHCLGAYWIVRGDDNKNASIAVQYRRAGEVGWHGAMPLFRVEKGANADEQFGTRVKVPQDGWLFAGSVVMLEPDTAYELKLSLADPEGGMAERVLPCRTRGEPAVAGDAPKYDVVPGKGGGSGTPADPYKGLAAAQAAAKPGDVMLLHAGRYVGTFAISKYGQVGKPIVWRGAGDGEAIIDGQGAAAERPARAISASEAHDVWFESLTIINANYAIVAHNAARIVVRRCHIYNTDYGFTATKDEHGTAEDYFIADNTIEGPCTWPRSKGIENPRGMQIGGAGHVICYNRISGFADGMDTFPSQRVCAIDFHNNDVSQCTDDGCEMDYSQRNTRNYCNRYTNVFQGISVQPVYGGPVYIFRNVLYNVVAETFKMHNSPSGALFFHNTSVKQGMPLILSTQEPVRHCVYRNNLFIGTDAAYCYENTAPMVDCDFDYDGFGGGPWKLFLKWNEQRYATMEQVRAKAPIYRHITLVDAATTFASGARPPSDAKQQVAVAPDLRLSTSSAAIDAGAALPNFNDGFAGKGPDLGAYELGATTPQYGPRVGR